MCITLTSCFGDHTRKKSDEGKNAGAKWLQSATFETGDERYNPQSNIMFGSVVENGDWVVFNNLVYDKKEGTVESICRNPACNHDPNNSTCLVNQGISCLQVYNGKILCRKHDGDDPKTGVIYALDPELGELDKRYETGIDFYDFIVVGRDLALVTADDGFYVVNLKSGQRVSVLKKSPLNSFYTVEGEYMYAALEDLELHKVSLRGEGDTVIAEHAGQPVAYNNNVYYGYWHDDVWNLRRVDINGEEDDAPSVLSESEMFSLSKNTAKE